jgi:sulfur-carrier protein adenylyltransferase/sulfurtransferase
MIKEITVKEVKKMLDNNEAFQFIDVREKAEVEVASIGAMNIPMGEVMDNLDKISKEKMTIVHCRSGARSAAICNALLNAGYSNVYNMKGGIKAWAEEIDPSISLN